MDIINLLTPERIACETEVSSKKRAFEQLAQMLACGNDETSATLDAQDIFNALTGREKLGCTALGNGVAIPHAGMPIETARGAMLVIEEGIKMDAPDRKPVQLFMAILVPEGSTTDYSGLITQLARTLSQKDLIEQICNFNDSRLMLDYLSVLFPPEEDSFGRFAA